jgi:hypothetical protein
MYVKYSIVYVLCVYEWVWEQYLTAVQDSEALSDSLIPNLLPCSAYYINIKDHCHNNNSVRVVMMVRNWSTNYVHIHE